MDSVPSIYFILGTPGSGRRALLADLIENGIEAGTRTVVLLEEGEEGSPGDEKLGALKTTEVRRWKWNGTELPEINLEGAQTVFFVGSSTGDPITQLEALKPWLVRHHAELARIFCVIDCQLAEKTPPLLPWYDACVHFSDVVFLANREGVANKWLSDFLRRYADEFVPSHFIQLKKTGVANPALVLEPQPRRVSQYFDEEDVVLPQGVEIEETDDEEDEEDAGDDGDTVRPEAYFERERSGRRVKELPNIVNYLPKSP
jgi:hypothetical protein